MDIHDYKKEELLKLFKERSGIHGFGINKTDENYGMAVLPFRNILSGAYEFDTWQGEFRTKSGALRRYKTDVTRITAERIAGGSAAFMLMAGGKYGFDILIGSRRSDTPPVLEVVFRDSKIHRTEIYADNTAYISSKMADMPHFDMDMMPLREDGGSDPVGGDTKRVYLRFPLDELAGADIVSAELCIYAASERERGTVLVINNGDAMWNERSIMWSTVGGNMYSFKTVPVWGAAPEYADSEYNNVTARFWFGKPMVYEYLSYLNDPAEYDRTHPYHNTYPGIEFAGKLIDMMSAFARQMPNGWTRTLDTGERLSRWTDIIDALLAAGAFDGRAGEFYDIIKFMHGDCEYLCGLDITDDSKWWSNWRIVANAGLFKAAEFLENSAFRKKAEANAVYSMDMLYNSDMSFKEAGPSYALWCAELFCDCAEAAQRSGRPMSGDFMTKLAGAARYAANVFYPGGYDSNIGDSNYRNKLSAFIRLAALTGDDTLKAYVTNDREYKKGLSALYPDANSAFMRTGWDKDGSVYLSFINSPFDGHCHPDSCQILMYAYGSPLLVDSGRYSYSSTNDIYARLRTAAAHNTVEAEGETMSAHSAAAGRMENYTENDMFTFVSSVENGYTGVRHERSLLFFKESGMYTVITDRITGGTDRCYRQNWHFMPSSGAAVSGNAVVTHFHDSANIAVISPGAEASVQDGYFSADYGLASKSRYASFERRGKSVSFMTVLKPLGREEKNTLSAESDNGLRVCGDGEIYFGKGEFGKYKSDAKFAFAGERGGLVYGMAHGTALSGDREYISSGSVIRSAAVEISGGIARISCDGSLSARLYAPGAERVVLNGNEITFSQSGEYITITNF